MMMYVDEDHRLDVRLKVRRVGGSTRCGMKYEERHERDLLKTIGVIPTNEHRKLLEYVTSENVNHRRYEYECHQ
jgi:hypothetical protein